MGCVGQQWRGLYLFALVAEELHPPETGAWLKVFPAIPANRYPGHSCDSDLSVGPRWHSAALQLFLACAARVWCSSPLPRVEIVAVRGTLRRLDWTLGVGTAFGLFADSPRRSSLSEEQLPDDPTPVRRKNEGVGTWDFLEEG